MINFVFDIVLFLDFYFNIHKVFNMSLSAYYDMQNVLAIIYSGFEIIMIVSALTLICNLIRVIREKDGSRRKYLIYILNILISSIAILSNFFILLILAATA